MHTLRYILFITLIIGLQNIANAGTLEENSEAKKDTLWDSKGIVNLTIGQTSFTNWAAGGENAVNGSFLFNYRTKYKNENIEWDNQIEVAYGGLFQDRFTLYKKTDDKLNLATKYGYKAGNKWNYSFYASLQTQLAKGFNYPNDSVSISQFMAPGYVHAGLGMDYAAFKELSILLSPITYKMTVVNNYELANQGAFGVEPAVMDTLGNVIKPANRFRSEPGGFIKIQFEKTFKKDLHIKSKLELFSSFINNPQNLDVTWNTLMSYKITKYFAATLAIDVLYDEDVKITIIEDRKKKEVGPRTQVKEILSFGLSYKL